MKITSVNIPESKDNLGLKKIELNRLENMVLLAGKNGSGKTRILTLLKKYIELKPTNVALDNAATAILSNEDYLKKSISSLDNLKKQLSLKPDNVNLINQINNMEKSIANIKISIERSQATKDWNFIHTDKTLDDKIDMVSLVPKSITLTDYRMQTETKFNQAFENVKTLGTNGLKDGVLIYIKKIQTRAFNVTHQNATQSAEVVSKAIKNFEYLVELIDKFLGTALERDIDGNPLLFSLPITDAKLSDGQKILLQLCVQIHAQSNSLDNLIIAMDEPENHLHPAASIDVIDALRKVATNCQIWIATHSLPILSYFNDATLLLVEDGSVNYAGSKPESVLSDLIGDDERIQKMQDFTSLPSIYAMNRYAAECLLPPATIGAKDRDDQTSQIQTHLSSIKSNITDRPLRLLDYGAGKGRLLNSLVDNSDDITSTIDYIAFDSFPDDADVCKEVIQKTYGDNTKRHFNKNSDLTAKYSKKYFDVIVMCNVLHEIDPNDWLTLFGGNGEVTSLLSDNGILLLVEDEEIPVGEKAYTKGFIVFDTTELKDLFDIQSDENLLYSDKRNDGRLKAHVIEKRWLERITNDTRCKSLEERQNRAAKEIIELRKLPSNYRNGRKHSFWTQQLANTVLALRELK